MSQRTFEERTTSYWWWFAGALFLLVPLDLFATLSAVAAYGLAIEANPVMRWLLRRGLVTVVLAHLAVTVGTTWLFSHLLASVRGTAAPYDRYLERGVSIWLRLLVAAGLLLQVNNAVVVLFGVSAR